MGNVARESENIWLYQRQYGCVDIIGGEKKLQNPSAARRALTDIGSPFRRAQTSGGSTNMLNYLKWLSLAALVLLSLFSLYTIWLWSNEYPSMRGQFGSDQIKRLKMVNVLCRHGDRAPSDAILKADPHGQHQELFWPNGSGNLTDSGKLRELKIGLQLRRIYKDYLSFNSSDILAFSSPFDRCLETIKLILRGLYDLEWTKAEGRRFAELGRRCFSCLSTGSGSPDQWEQVKVDTETIPSLTYRYLDSCRYRIEHPSAIDKNLLLSEAIRNLEGVDRLKEIMKQRYDLDFNYTVSGLWSTISCEMNLYRTQATFNYTNHYNDWANLVASRRGDSVVTMMELMEQVTTVLYRERLSAIPTYIQDSPIVTSIVESQLVALGRRPTNPRMKLYENKKMVLIATHDSVLQNLLNDLGIIHAERKFEDAFHDFKSKKRLIDSSNGLIDDDINEQLFLSGMTMSSFGMSIRFELWEYSLPDELLAGLDSARKVSGLGFPALQASIYNKEEAKYQDIIYKPIKLGQVCRRKFRSKHPTASESELAAFYPNQFDIDWLFSCPFKLFQNITADLILDQKRVDQLCK